MTSDSAGAQVSASVSANIEVTPATASADQPVSIRLTGFVPGQTVRLTATMKDDADTAWQSHAVFRADDAGVVDVGSQESLSGTYLGVDRMGIFWSMLPGAEAGENVRFAKNTLSPMEVAVAAEADGETIASTTLTRRFLAQDVTRVEVRDSGLAGTLFHLTNGGPHPGVMIFGGSEGGLSEIRASLLASHGFAAFALAYFSFEHLPTELVEIPLEYFKTAIDWLQSHDAVQGDRLAAVGASKGGELALLMGSTFPQIKAVVGYVPGAVAFNGIGRGVDDPGQGRSSWAYKGVPVPFVTRGDFDTSEDSQLLDTPVSLTPLYLKGLEDSDAVEKATTRVENIQGPALLISGGDDQMWPSSVMADMVIKRLSEHNHPHPYEHLMYGNAGHSIGNPYVPSTVLSSLHAVRGILTTPGGSAKENAHASADSWPRMLEFLKRALKE
ncbi:MAG: acyl-CoA thioesterase/bile acid-CoA:amino acid N-acyltransferase family protein [SAR202 cluster bacterium]|nr:acyl-CoA thioesterase/bile acid-CoA:amino acid N-acyltransferase family protein [SAR202 cluster bacterium]MDP6513093.1 acyl-CoA thioesterase/bile acid-CoA:amino acid N-acyltransferase family protein [SAR202 cluster bacterium]MDP6716037.1 acyl-CoA thioesterase/bile acid-CoA:amino acid N-acyltransferase family protein [SAR202 cluster bacterium]